MLAEGRTVSEVASQWQVNGPAADVIGGPCEWWCQHPGRIRLAPWYGAPFRSRMRAMAWTRGGRALALGGFGVTAVCTVADLPLTLTISNAPELSGAAYGGSSGYGNFAFEVPMLLLAGLATLIVIRRGGNRVGWLLLGAAAWSAISGLASDYGAYAVAVRHHAVPAGDALLGLGNYGWLVFVGLLVVLPIQVFPDGRLASPRWRWLLWTTVAVIAVGYLGNTFGPGQDISAGGQHGQPGAAGTINFPHATSGVLGALLGAAQFALPAFAACGLLGLASLVLRYRRSSSEVRHQIRWLLFAALLYVVPYATYTILNLAFNVDLTLLATISVVALALVPFAMAIAVLKYRLYDIDVIISRAFVYGSLAALITGLYVAIVVGIGRALAGGGRPNLLLDIAATAVVALGFQPARERLQHIANRLVYGKRAAPYEVLSQFSVRVAGSYAAADLLPQMARVLAEGTASDRADVWLMHDGVELKRAATWPLGDEDVTRLGARRVTGGSIPDIAGDHIVAVSHQGETLGALSVTKRRGEMLTPIEQKLMDDLSHQAGLVLKNVGLTTQLTARLDDLRESRKRLVAAQDDERRRLERNLHDGAQQNLVALKIKLGLVETLAGKDPERARHLLTQLKSDADEALETLRDLARGIYPPLLADRGLVAALEARARKATVPTEVDADGVGRYPLETEAAVYFCVLEALQNVQKYARATAVSIRLAVDDGHLVFTVRDDGAGFDPAHAKRGSGLQNMEDRLDALGGALAVASVPSQGTEVSGSVPLHSETTVLRASPVVVG